MNSKSFVLGVFVVWSILCWYRYVCGIKQQCGDQQPIVAQQAIPFEPESVLTNPERSPNEARGVAPSEPAASPSPAASPPEPDMSRVQVEELEDHVLIHFPYNSTRKEDNAAIDDYLSRLAQQLRGSQSTVTLIGHTDNVGDSKTNYNFALRRAKNIRDILVTKGVKKQQIICKSQGEKQHIASNDTPQGRYKNRRVEIRVNPK